jgi:hypothetical protein
MQPPLLAQAAIECNTNELLNGQCTFDYNKLIGIKQDMDPEEANDANLFVADIFLAATFFIGTLAFLGLIISGLRYIFAGGNDPKAASKATSGIKYSLIGLAIVIFSYTIIRLIQYIVAARI